MLDTYTMNRDNQECGVTAESGEGFTVETNYAGMSARFVNPVINSEASTYLSLHLNEVINYVRSKHTIDPSKVDDLINDVWESLRNSELEGEGYDISHSRDGDVITVAQYVYGRINGYAANHTYHIGSMEKRLSKDPMKTIDIVSASCSDASDLDSLDGYQKAYALAASEDDIDMIDDMLSLRSNIDICRAYDKDIGFGVVNLLKNIDMFASVDFNSGIFDKVRKLVARSEEFRDAFHQILSVAVKSKPAFDSVVESLTN